VANSAAVMMGLLEAFQPFYPVNDSYATTAIQHACDIPFLAGVLGVYTETPCDESFDALFWFSYQVSFAEEGSTPFEIGLPTTPQQAVMTCDQQNPT